ncbi:MAG: A/G-specific adenine glycosylase [Candidatus Fimenecus sp.]
MHTKKEIEKQYAALPALLLPWYRENARDLPWRHTKEPYRVWVSEIMLQQTRVEAVRGYYDRFLTALPDIKALSEADEEQLLKLWEGLGYYSRVRNLQKAAKTVMGQHGGVFPKDYADVRALAGIGDYTAGAICSICYGQPRAAVDGNVLRIAARITEDFSPIDLADTKKRVAEQLEKVYPAGECDLFTQALMELGACVCTPRSPKCGECPVKAICFAEKVGTVEKLPVKLPKKEKRQEKRTVFLLECDSAYAVCKRTEKGLLSGLWQLPNVADVQSPADALKTAESFGAKPVELTKEVHKTHIFTHIVWDMVGYHIRCSVKADSFIWATPQELQTTYALPTAFRIFLEG